MAEYTDHMMNGYRENLIFFGSTQHLYRRTTPRCQTNLHTPQPHNRPGTYLGRLAQLQLAIDGDNALSHHDLASTTTVAQADQLEQLVEFDRRSIEIRFIA